MTNAIPKGSCNLSINMDERERSIWSKAAYDQEIAVGEMFRRMALEWAKAERPEIAMQVEEVRLRRRKEIARSMIGSFLLLIVLHIGWEAMQPGSDEHDICRTRGTTPRVCRSRRVREKEFEA